MPISKYNQREVDMKTFEDAQEKDLYLEVDETSHSNNIVLQIKRKSIRGFDCLVISKEKAQEVVDCLQLLIDKEGE